MRDINECSVCGEDDKCNGEWACAFSGCVKYVDQLERVLRYAESYLGRIKDPLLGNGLQIEIEKAKKMGAGYGRPFDWGVKT